MAGPQKPGPRLGFGKSAEVYRKAQPYLDAAWRLIGGVLVGTFGGYLLDNWLGTTPWLLIVLALAGMGAGFAGMMKALSKTK